MLILTGMEAAGPTLQGVLPLHLLSAKAQEIATATSPSKGHPYKKANKNIHMLKTTPRHIIFYPPLEKHFYQTIFICWRPTGQSGWLSFPSGCDFSPGFLFVWSMWGWRSG